eukprot:scaffold3504_cov240-Pinguiococcus_pyrenoidosus.AAC.3
MRVWELPELLASGRATSTSGNQVGARKPILRRTRRATQFEMRVAAYAATADEENRPWLEDVLGDASRRSDSRNGAVHMRKRSSHTRRTGDVKSRLRSRTLKPSWAPAGVIQPPLNWDYDMTPTLKASIGSKESCEITAATSSEETPSTEVEVWENASTPLPEPETPGSTQATKGSPSELSSARKRSSRRPGIYRPFVGMRIKLPGTTDSFEQREIYESPQQSESEISEITARTRLSKDVESDGDHSDFSFSDIHQCSKTSKESMFSHDNHIGSFELQKRAASERELQRGQPTQIITRFRSESELSEWKPTCLSEEAARAAAMFGGEELRKSVNVRKEVLRRGRSENFKKSGALSPRSSVAVNERHGKMPKSKAASFHFKTVKKSRPRSLPMRAKGSKSKRVSANVFARTSMRLLANVRSISVQARRTPSPIRRKIKFQRLSDTPLPPASDVWARIGAEEVEIPAPPVRQDSSSSKRAGQRITKSREPRKQSKWGALWTGRSSRGKKGRRKQKQKQRGTSRADSSDHGAATAESARRDRDADTKRSSSPRGRSPLLRVRSEGRLFGSFMSNSSIDDSIEIGVKAEASLQERRSAERAARPFNRMRPSIDNIGEVPLTPGLVRQANIARQKRRRAKQRQRLQERHYEELREQYDRSRSATPVKTSPRTARIDDLHVRIPPVVGGAAEEEEAPHEEHAPNLSASDTGELGVPSFDVAEVYAALRDAESAAEDERVADVEMRRSFEEHRQSNEQGYESFGHRLEFRDTGRPGWYRSAEGKAHPHEAGHRYDPLRDAESEHASVDGQGVDDQQQRQFIAKLTEHLQSTVAMEKRIDERESFFERLNKVATADVSAPPARSASGSTEYAERKTRTSSYTSMNSREKRVSSSGSRLSEMRTTFEETSRSNSVVNTREDRVSSNTSSMSDTRRTFEESRKPFVDSRKTFENARQVFEGGEDAGASTATPPAASPSKAFADARKVFEGRGTDQGQSEQPPGYVGPKLRDGRAVGNHAPLDAQRLVEGPSQ